MARGDERRESARADFGRVVSLAVLIGSVAAILAAAAIWLLLTQPVVVATAVESGEVTPLIRELADALVQALMALLEYL